MKHLESLINYLSNEVFVSSDDCLKNICKTTIDTLKSFDSTKKKYVCGNQIPFMTLSKEIMTRSTLRNKLKHKMKENRLLYTQQKNKLLKYVTMEI